MGTKVARVTSMTYMANVMHLGFASHLRERNPLLGLSGHAFLCHLFDQPVDFVE